MTIATTATLRDLITNTAVRFARCSSCNGLVSTEHLRQAIEPRCLGCAGQNFTLYEKPRPEP